MSSRAATVTAVHFAAPPSCYASFMGAAVELYWSEGTPRGGTTQGHEIPRVLRRRALAPPLLNQGA